MPNRLSRSLCLLLSLLVANAFTAIAHAQPKPIRALLVTGGCCHDYSTQKNLIADGLSKRAHIEVTVIQQGGSTTDSKIELYQDADWAKDYDIVLHDECFAAVDDPAWTQRILKPHQDGLPAVVIHCAMHCYRDGTDQWFKFCGVTSRGHGPHYGHEVLNRNADHLIMKEFGPAWMNPKGELYEIEKLWDTATPLASSKNRSKGNEEVCVWTNQYGDARVFGTTLGHHNETVSSDAFLDLLTRGTLWATNKLNSEYLKDKEVDPRKAIQEAEEKLLAEVEIPAGFDATIFAAPPAVKYPVFVAAAPDGVVYVAVDQNGSLDRELKRGAIYRLRDLDDDGRADEVKLFVDDVDSPRGMVWDHDRLYVMHPPHLSAFIDTDDDGISDKQEILVSDIAFTFKDRPADHTSNGVTMGIDGWLYLAIGDFGFMQAEGADGRKLQMRGGGVVRVRPDGSGLQTYSNGTRNILEVAVDPLLNGFTRDNTNDGGGWDIRLHHFSGFEDHGYPRLYMNFNDEIIQPLADYGGGSGCGALYLDEPGFPEGMGNALYTADWGREKVFRHQMQPNGATFTPTQDDFVGLARVTDLDVDANSRLYLSSWKGASFTYVGDEVGFVVQLRPQGFKPEPLPDTEALNGSQLVQLLLSPSHRRRVEAQRAILRKGLDVAGTDALFELANSADRPLASRVAALFALKQLMGNESHRLLARLAKSAELQPFALRAIADRWDETENIDSRTFVDGLSAELPRTRLEAAVGMARLNLTPHAISLTHLLSDPDPVVAHTAVQSLIRLQARQECIAVLDKAVDAQMRIGAMRVLQSLHDKDTVDDLLDRIAIESEPAKKRALLTALCRLHFIDGEWKGNSWGTRPDTRGPYYQPETWEESERIAKQLLEHLDIAEGEEAEFLVKELARHRISSPKVGERLIAMARESDSMIPIALQHLKEQSELDADSRDFVVSLASREELPIEHKQALIPSLLSIGDRSAVEPILTWMSNSQNRKERMQLGGAVYRNDKIVDAVDALVELSSEESDTGKFALMALASASRRKLDDTKKAKAAEALESAWTQPKRRVDFLEAIRAGRNRDQADKVQMALQDENPEVVALAKELAKRWKLTPSPTPAGPTIKTLDPTEVLLAAIAARGSIEHGKAVFERLQCGKCHTVKQDEPLRGPYLPNVAKTYKRAQLAEAVLLPSKTIAQGFVTNTFVLDDGTMVTGFVTNEADTEITIRDAEAKESKISVESIEDRQTQKISVMPEGLVNDVTVEDFGSLLSYLESLGN